MAQETSGMAVDRSLYRIIESMNEIVIVMDLEKKVVCASDAARKMLGMGDGDLMGVPAAKFLPSFSLDAVLSRVRSPEPSDRIMTINVSKSLGQQLVLETHLSLFTECDHELVVLSCRDIDKFASKLAALSAREDLYRTIFHKSPVGFLHINSDGIVAECNQLFLDIFGFFKEEIIGINVADPNSGKLDELVRKAALDAVIGSGSTYENKFRYESPLGTKEGWSRVTFSPIISETKSFLGAVGIIEDITDAKEAQEKIEYIGNHDALTGLFNRHKCSAMMEEMDVPENLPIGIIYADLNHLKLANDAFGHHEGDGLLSAFAEVLKSIEGPNGTSYRLGGDEFVVLIKKTDKDDLAARVSEILEKCRCWAGGGIVHPSAALGRALKTDPSQNINELLKDAEDAMYANKLQRGPAVRMHLMATLEDKLKTLMNGSIGRRGERMMMWSEWAADLLGIQPGSNEHKDLEMLFRYHDIGLLGYSDEVQIIKTPPLSEARKEPLQHTITGYRIARTVSELGSIADLILLHHEKWDGTGSPSQIAGEKIPYLSRVVSIFDALEGMLSLSSPDARLTFNEAVDAIEAGSGSFFDPELCGTIVHELRTAAPEFVC